LNARLENGSPEYPARRRKGDPARSQYPAALKSLLHALPLEERRAQAPGDGHILEDTPLIPSPKLFTAGASAEEGFAAALLPRQ
jgi:hypothetical protein